jgi:hypothetical protein
MVRRIDLTDTTEPLCPSSHGRSFNITDKYSTRSHTHDDQKGLPDVPQIPLTRKIQKGIGWKQNQSFCLAGDARQSLTCEFPCLSAKVAQMGNTDGLICFTVFRTEKHIKETNINMEKSRVDAGGTGCPLPRLLCIQ